MKYDLDRRGMKNGKNCMHWNGAPDALPGSVCLVCVFDHWVIIVNMLDRQYCVIAS